MGLGMCRDVGAAILYFFGLSEIRYVVPVG